MFSPILLANIQPLLYLVAAHIFIDFFWQPDSWVADKRQRKAKSPYLYLHIALCWLLSWVALAAWNWWYVALFIGLTHLGIDLAKLYFDQQGQVRGFLLDQAAHFLVLLIAWMWITPATSTIYADLAHYWHTPRFVVVVLAYLMVLTPTGVFIQLFTKRWIAQLPSAIAGTSLQEAGRYIGWFERLLVLTFVLLGQYEAIGLLIAAKSILRLKEGELKESEYIVVGTLLSFSIAIFVGVLAQRLLARL